MLLYLEVARLVLPFIVSLLTDRSTVQNAGEMEKSIDTTVKSVTEASTPDEAKQKLETNPELLSKLNISLAELANEAKRIDNEAEATFNTAANANTADARQMLLKLLHEPESKWVTYTPAILSYMVVVGFFVLIIAMFREKLPADSDLRQLLNICVGAVVAGFTNVLGFWLGSSLGSRRKDTTTALGTTVQNVKTVLTPVNREEPAGAGTAAGPQVQTISGSTQAASTRRPLPASLQGVGPSTDSSTVNASKNIPFEPGKLPASVRYNNPGAQYPSREAARYGQLGFGMIGGGHKIACFPSPVNGAASNFDLLSRKYTGLPIGEAGKKWTGANGFGVPGYDSNMMITKATLDDPEQAIPLLKAIAQRESGNNIQTKLTDEQWRHAFGMYKSGSADAFLAQFGQRPIVSRTVVRPDGPPGESLADVLINAMQNKKYNIDNGIGQVNIIYVEGMNEDGSPNNDEANVFNDLRCVIDFQQDGTPRVLGKWQATTEPGFYYDRDHPLNDKGAARIKFGQYRSWVVGLHKGNQEALRQARDVTVCRDLNRDMERTGDALDTGLFGINQHGGYDMPEDNIGKASAGCLVGRTMAGQKEFMAIVKSDPRYAADSTFMFATTILSAVDVLQPSTPPEA